MTRRLPNLLVSIAHSLLPSPGGMLAVGVFGLLSTMFMTGHVPADAPRTWWRPVATVLIFSGLLIAFGAVRLRRAIAQWLAEERRRRSKASGLLSFLRLRPPRHAGPVPRVWHRHD